MADDFVWASWREDDTNHVVGYMCLTDWEYELGGASGGNTVYPTVEDLTERRSCVEHCGIVEVEVRYRRTVQEPKREDPEIGDDREPVPATPLTILAETAALYLGSPEMAEEDGDDPATLRRNTIVMDTLREIEALIEAKQALLAAEAPQAGLPSAA